jgi:hypothetical protein
MEPAITVREVLRRLLEGGSYRFCRKSSPETAAVYDRRQRVRQGGG